MEKDELREIVEATSASDPSSVTPTSNGSHADGSNIDPNSSSASLESVDDLNDQSIMDGQPSEGGEGILENDPTSKGDPMNPADEAEGQPPVEEGEPEPQTPETLEESLEKTFTQEQVNQIAGKSREEGRRKGYEQARKEFQERYGVGSDDELDDIYSKGSRFDELSARFDDRDGLLKEAQTELALVKSGVDPLRYDDVKAILGSKGMEVSEESIKSMLPTHPEWAKKSSEASEAIVNPVPQPKAEGPMGDSKPQSVGTIPLPQQDEDEAARKQAERLFGLKF